MASSTITTNAKSSKQDQLVSTMIKQGFISDPFLSPSSSSPPSSCHHSRPKLSTLLPPLTLPCPAQSHPTNTPSRAVSTPNSFEMMSEEQARETRQSSPEARSRAQHKKVLRLLGQASFVDLGVGDVRLTVAAREDGGTYRVSMDVHRRVLAGKSRFFADKLRRNGTHSVEILDCDEVEIYVETIMLMYCNDLKRKLMGEDVSRVLELLKVCSAILFDAGRAACLEYLESVPWSEEEEEKVVSHLGQLQLDPSSDVLQRVVVEPLTYSRADDIFLQLLTGVLLAKDDKARREMKTTVSCLLREDIKNNSGYENRVDISKETLYHLCHRCLSSLVLCLSEATCIDEAWRDRGAFMGEIAREADNMQWIIEILIDRKLGDDFVKLWADQKELANLHSKIPTMYRHEISRITAQLCIAIGRGHILVPKDTRYLLLSTWLDALYEDFGWMSRASRSIDKKLVEDGLSQTILTLSLSQQKAILLNWFDRFLNKGDDCPNIRKAFEIWWRRAFVRQYIVDSQLHIAVYGYPN